MRNALLCVLFLLTTAPMWGQTDTGVITGIVTDQAGAVIPSAKVTITSQSTGVSRDITTDSHGYFTSAADQPGHLFGNGHSAWFPVTDPGGHSPPGPGSAQSQFQNGSWAGHPKCRGHQCNSDHRHADLEFGPGDFIRDHNADASKRPFVPPACWP